MIPGARPPRPQELTRVQDRLTFIYLEHTVISRDSNAITATDSRGTVHIPAALVSCLMLGPGTKITHQAMTLIGESGASVVWVGESGVRFYAGGEPLARSSHLLIAQAKLVSNERSRIAIARQMYGMRFPGEDVSSLSMQQLRGKEGARVRKSYREQARKTKIEWRQREYLPGDFEAGSPINQAMTAAHSCLYGITHAAIVALGCAPGLGFVHNGHSRSFVYDVADLYKAETSIPTAFQVVQSGYDDLSTAVRYAMRDSFSQNKTLERIVTDIRLLLGSAGDETDSEALADVVTLWDPLAQVSSGTNYSPQELTW